MSENVLTKEHTETQLPEPDFETRLSDYLVEKGRLKEEDLQRGIRLNKESFSVSLVPL